MVCSHRRCVRSTRAVEKHARRNRALGWAIGLAFSASVLFAGAWLKGRPVIGFSYWLVPDGVSLAETCMVVVQLGVQDAFAGIPGYEIGLPPSPLLLLLYSWSLSMIGPLGFVWVNAVVLFWISWRTSPWIVLSLPCLLVAIAMPSKEILLAPLTLVGWWALGRRRFLTLTLTCGLAFLVRDGAGIAICVWIIGSLVAARLHVRGIFIVAAALVSGLVIHVWLGYILGAPFLIDRNVVAFGSIDSPVSASAFSTFGYAVRWFANLTALAFRPALPLDTESNVPVLAVSYWLCGLTILATAQDSLRHLLGRPPWRMRAA